MTLFSSYGRIGYDKHVISDLSASPGVVGDGGTVATFRYAGDRPITPKELHLDLEFEVEIEIERVELAAGPNEDEATQPWGSLENRLRALHKAVLEYTEGLVYLAQHPEAAEG